jgi:hypothetical protein
MYAQEIQQFLAMISYVTLGSIGHRRPIRQSERQRLVEPVRHGANPLERSFKPAMLVLHVFSPSQGIL